jgi:threonine dehydrogenase-like Zn-dependent dehydrogenase
MTEMMRATVLHAPGPPEALVIRELPVPDPAAGQVLIRVKAFGRNRSELHTRLAFRPSRRPAGRRRCCHRPRLHRSSPPDTVLPLGPLSW